MTAEQVIERETLATDPEAQVAVVKEVRGIIDQIGALLPNDPQDELESHALLADCAALRGSLVAFADLEASSRTIAMLTSRGVDLFLKGPHELQAVAQDLLAWIMPDMPPLAFITEAAWCKFREACADVPVPARISRLQYAKTLDYLKRIVGVDQPQLQGAALDAAAYKLAIELMQRDIAQTKPS